MGSLRFGPALEVTASLNSSSETVPESSVSKRSKSPSHSSLSTISPRIGSACGGGHAAGHAAAARRLRGHVAAATWR